MMKSSRADRPDSPRARRWKVGIGVGASLLAVTATIPWYDLPDAAWSRRLVQVHEAKAVECRRLERLARADHPDEARRLARFARNHDWFAEAYRVQLARSRLNPVQLVVEGVRGVARSFGSHRST